MDFETKISKQITDNIKVVEKFPLRVLASQKVYWLRIKIPNECFSRDEIVKKVLEATGRQIKWIDYNEIEIPLGRRKYIG